MDAKGVVKPAEYLKGKIRLSRTSTLDGFRENNMQ